MLLSIGDIGSKVHGFLHDEIFEGKIRTSSGSEFHIEPAWKYLNDSKFHSIIYDVDNMHYPFPHGAGCGLRNELRDWMLKMQRSHVTEKKGKEEDIAKSTTGDEDTGNIRVRRASSAKTSCRLYIQVRRPARLILNKECTLTS